MFSPIFSLESPVSVEKNGVDTVSIIPLAYCSVTNRLVTVDAKLSFINDLEIQLEKGLVLEFSFEFTIIYIDNDEPSFKTQDRLIVAGYLDAACRSLALPAVLKAIPPLLDAAAPERIYRVTKRGNLPTKALRKHDLITKAFEDQKYEVVTCERDIFSRDFWIMERRSGS